MAKVLSLVLLLFALVVCSAPETCAQTTEFTYQGSLRDGAVPATGNYDFEFLLFDSLADGSQIGLTLARNGVAVSNGGFSVNLDFGNQFPGANRFLEIRVRQTGGGAFTILTPRQSVTSVPYSVKSLSADSASSAATATDATQLNGQPAAFYQNAANLSSGSLADARLAGAYTGTLTLSNAGNAFTGAFSGAFSGSGSGLTGLNASNVSSGTLADARLSSNVGLLTNAQTFTGAKTFSVAPSFTAAGAPFSVSSATLVTNLNADRLDGLDSTAFLQSVPSPLTLSGTSVSHIMKGENASTGVFARGVHGAATGASGATIGVLGESASSSGMGVAGVATAAVGETYGGRFESNSTGFGSSGVYGLAAATTGITYGVYGQNESTLGRGVYGLASAVTGNTSGVYGQSDSTSGRGVFGLVNRLNGTTSGVWGRVDSTDGRGVFGHATHGTGLTYGGRFESDSVQGRGVFGYATNTSGTAYGVYGQSATVGGRGVFGYATSSAGTPYGVRGEAVSPTGYGVYSVGDMGASGAKPFRIDHPDDPANKYLLHYATESPEVINFYRGTVVLDSAGEAVVELPHYFAKINKTPSYQLTAVGAPMPMLHVAEEIDEATLSVGAKMEPGQTAPVCSFRIAGGAPGAKVSWRIEAVRNDRWVQKRGAPVEVGKQELEKGTYQHPELYGQPAEKGMDYDAARKRPEPARP